jgi:hypothetical protein
MSALTEIDAIKLLADALEQLDDQAARERVLRWAWAKFSQQPLPMPGGQGTDASRKRPARSARKKKTTKPSPSIVKDLDLRPEGRESFREFAGGKKPTTNLKKCTVAVYYLTQVLGVAGVDPNHVFTCFKDAKWRVPADLHTTLAETASRDGWLDTSDMDNIRLTPRGETMVEHDLPGTSATGDPR